MQPLKSLLVPALAGVAALLASAQEAPPGPAQALSAVAPLAGGWEGSGIVRMSADEKEPQRWTATIDAEWILDGHAMREVTRVDFAGAMPPIVLDTVYCYDAEKKQLAQYSASTMGGLDVADVFLSPEAGVLVASHARTMEGHSILDRAIHRVEKDSLTYVIERSVDGMPMHEHVAGTFKRRAAGSRPIQASAAKAAALAEPLAPLAPMSGTWHLAGSYTPAPGVPAMKITGVDTIVPVLEGHALAIDTVGTAEGSDFTYKALSLIAWNEEEGSFHQAWIDNMGMAGHSPLHSMGDGVFVSVHTGNAAGVPYCDRSEIRCADGKLVSSRADRMSGSHPAATMFEARYTPKK